MYDLSEEYVSLDPAMRLSFIRDILKDKSLSAADLRGLRITFSFDRPAVLAIFEAETVRQALDMEKEPGVCGNITAEFLLDRCRDVSLWGTEWDVDKVKIVNDTLNTMYPDMTDSIYWTPERAAEDNAEMLNNLSNFEKSVKQNPVVVTFSVPMGYALDGNDDPIFQEGYPQDAMRSIEADYLQINGAYTEEDGIYLRGDHFLDGEKGIPLNTYLQFSTAGDVAKFVFTETKDYHTEDRDVIIQMAQEWLMGQLSDGWGEDMVRHERLVGHRVVCPYLMADKMLADIPAVSAVSEQKRAVKLN